MKEGWLRVIVPVLFFVWKRPVSGLLARKGAGTFPAAKGNVHFNDN